MKSDSDDQPMLQSSFFTEMRIPQQRPYNGFIFPADLSPNPNVYNNNTQIPSQLLPLDLTQAITTHKPWVDSLLHQTGAILFRGFPLTSASNFNDFVEAFGFDELPYVGGAASRTNVVGRVFTANESPLDQKIPFHHEMAQVAEYPSKLFFFCEIEPESGGETPIVLSHIMYKRMKDKYPEFIEQLEEHGLIYTRVLGEEDNPSSPIGRSWKSTFSTQDRVWPRRRQWILVCPLYICQTVSSAAKLGTRLEWVEGGVKTTMGPMNADGTRQRKIWFNSMAAAYTGWGDPGNAVKAGVMFGDGKPLPADIIYDCFRILDEESVSIPWQKGDVFLLDNLTVLHSRSPCNSPHRVLASLCK